MFSEIYSYRQYPPAQTYSIIGCCIFVTVATMVFPNLQHVFGSFDEQTGLSERLTIAYQHGFDVISSIVHLLVDVALFFVIGIYTEKICGPKLFFRLNAAAILFYAVVHILFNMTGHGATGILWAYTPIIFYSLNEARILKTRSVFDEFYSTLRTVLLLMFTLIPVLLSIVPIYFSSELSLLESVFYGNIFILTSVILGLAFVALYKTKVRARLKAFAKKKKFEPNTDDRFSSVYPWLYPVLIIVGFIFS